MTSVKETFHESLKAAGYSLTAARNSVFEALVGQEPLSMHDLVLRANSVDRASVYRAVELFERIGVVQRLNTGWKYKVELTDLFTAHHHHVTCTTCGATTAINEEALEQFIVRLAQTHGFVPTAHQIEIQGLCATCQASTP